MTIRKLRKPNYPTKVIKSNDETITLQLIDETKTLTKGEFFDAFTVVFSREFELLIDAINMREVVYAQYSQKENTAFDAVQDLCDGTISCDELKAIQYEAFVAAREFGRTDCATADIKNNIIDNIGFNKWWCVGIVYEAFTGVSRDWL